MSEEKKGFLAGWLPDSQKPVIVLHRFSMIFSVAFHPLMMIFMKNWKKFW